MRDPFLCHDCQKLGYCRKYNTKPQERNFDKEEEAFFQRVNKPTVKVYQVLPATSVKLISLEKIRTQFKKHDELVLPELIKNEADFSMQSSQLRSFNYKISKLLKPVITKKYSRLKLSVE
jgi:hypothetical protein